MTRRYVLVSALALALALNLTLGLSRAGAASACSERVLADWASDSRIDGRYPASCYRQAVGALPEDLRAYSSAAEDIQHALNARLSSVTRIAPIAQDSGSDDGLIRTAIMLGSLGVIAVLAIAVLR